MKAIQFKECNTVYAEEQDEYISLPVYREENGTITCCMELDIEEIKEVWKTRNLYLRVLTFKNPLQPVRVSLYKPIFPTAFHFSFMYAPVFESSGLAVFKIHLLKKEVMELRRTKQIWITVRTFGAPLQPINTNISK